MLRRICTIYNKGWVESIEYAEGYDITYYRLVDGYILSRRYDIFCRYPQMYFNGYTFFCTTVPARYKTYLEAEAALIVYLSWDNYPSVVGGIKS